MLNDISFSHSLIILFSINSIANAACPSDVIIQDQLTCSNTINGTVDHLTDSYLGGSCDDLECYTCGEPFENETQILSSPVGRDFSCRNEYILLIATDERKTSLEWWKEQTSSFRGILPVAPATGGRHSVWISCLFSSAEFVGRGRLRVGENCQRI